MKISTLIRPAILIIVISALLFSSLPLPLISSLVIATLICHVVIEIYFFKKTEIAIKQIIKKIEKIKDAISGTGEQISSSCNQIDESTQEQSSAVTQTSAASCEITSMIEMTSSNVNKVAQSIEGINKTINISSELSIELENNFIESKESNKNTIQMMSETVGLLNELTTQFQDVISKTAIINDIVFQTRLLSFNASVEAARAGEHGKGFAVVAEEIGSLANLSGKSAKDINVTLEETNKKVASIINKITNSSKSLVETFTQQSASTQSCLENFKSNFKTVHDRTRMIGEELISLSSASTEQSKGVSEMSSAIIQVNESINRNTLVVAQTAKLANVLNDEILNLSNSINAFKEETFINEEIIIDEIPWENRYSIGIQEMDNEHILILDNINNLIKAMNQNSKNDISKAYLGLYKITKEHFSHEEDRLQEMNYPSFESHKKIHENLINKLVSFKNKIEKDELDKPMLASFLRNWLFTHIMGIDVKYADFEKSAHHKTSKKFRLA